MSYRLLIFTIIFFYTFNFSHSVAGMNRLNKLQCCKIEEVQEVDLSIKKPFIAMFRIDRSGKKGIVCGYVSDFFCIDISKQLDLLKKAENQGKIYIRVVNPSDEYFLRPVMNFKLSDQIFCLRI